MFNGSSAEKKESPDSTDPEHLEEEPPAETAEAPVASESSGPLIAVILPTESYKASGVVYFEKTGEGVRVSGRITGLLPGDYGLTVHRYGDISVPDGSSTGDSLNPDASGMGSVPSPEHSNGNSETITATGAGVAEFSFVDSGLSVEGADSILGRGLIVARNANEPAETSGATDLRVGMAVIGFADPEVFREARVDPTSL